MRDLNEYVELENIENLENKIEHDMKVDDFSPYISRLFETDDIDEKLIFFIERQVRTSFEYREYIKYLKEELDLNTCALLPNVDVKTTPISLEFHHFPLTLFDITQAITSKLVSNSTNEGVSTLEIAEEVMKEHFYNNVGLVPVTKTIHEMAHNGAIYIPMKKVNGNYLRFIAKYKSYIDPGVLEKISYQEGFNDSDEAKEYNSRKLSKKVAKYNIIYNKGDLPKSNI